MRPLMGWAGGMDDEEIDQDVVVEKSKSNFWMTQVNVERMDELAWTFLSLALHIAITCPLVFFQGHSLQDNFPHVHGSSPNALVRSFLG